MLFNTDLTNFAKVYDNNKSRIELLNENLSKLFNGYKYIYEHGDADTKT